MISGREVGRAMVVTEERLFPGREICYEDCGGVGAKPSKCGQGGEGGRCAMGDGLADAGVKMLRVTGLVVRVLRVAGVAVGGRNVSGVVLSR
jgi:hypothetical protein